MSVTSVTGLTIIGKDQFNVTANVNFKIYERASYNLTTTPEYRLACREWCLQTGRLCAES